jgi:hypothetical protein
LNYEKNNGIWPTSVGWLEDSRPRPLWEAVKYAEAALAQAPDDMNRNNVSKMIEKLKAKQDAN